MSITVEPVDGTDLERLVTALLNATGCFRAMIDAELDAGLTDPLEVIGVVAEGARQLLAPVAEHHADEELAGAVEILAAASLLLALGVGMDDVFFEA